LAAHVSDIMARGVSDVTELAIEGGLRFGTAEHPAYIEVVHAMADLIQACSMKLARLDLSSMDGHISPADLLVLLLAVRKCQNLTSFSIWLHASCADAEVEQILSALPVGIVKLDIGGATITKVTTVQLLLGATQELLLNDPVPWVPLASALTHAEDSTCMRSLHIGLYGNTPSRVHVEQLLSALTEPQCPVHSLCLAGPLWGDFRDEVLKVLPRLISRLTKLDIAEEVRIYADDWLSVINVLHGLSVNLCHLKLRCSLKPSVAIDLVNACPKMQTLISPET
jgi:hypothetical protein